MSIDNRTTKSEFLRSVFAFNEDTRMLEELAQGDFDKKSVFVLRGKYSPFSDGGELIIFVEMSRKEGIVGWGYQDGSVMHYPCLQAAWDDLTQNWGAIHLF